MNSPLRVERWTGPVEEFVARPVPDGLASVEAWICEPPRPVLVLGSSQRADVADPSATEAAGVDVVHRRSGGGAVFLAPGRSLWLDILLPRDDGRWLDDVSLSAHWLGELWAASLGRLGVAADVYRSGLERTRWGRLVCFAARGPGEVTTPARDSAAGRKVVGIAQRRTRAGARFQCLVLADWNPRDVLDLLVMDEADRELAAAELSDVASGAGVPLDALEREFLALLAR